MCFTFKTMKYSKFESDSRISTLFWLDQLVMKKKKGAGKAGFSIQGISAHAGDTLLYTLYDLDIP